MAKNSKVVNPYTPLAPSGEDNRLECSSQDLEAELEENEQGRDPAENLDNLLTNLSLENNEAKIYPRPLYYGWFFKEEICSALVDIGKSYLQQCFFAVPQFERFLLSACESRGVKDYSEYYQYPGKKKKKSELPKYHVTATFCGREKRLSEVWGEKYADHLDSETDIQIIGLFFTENTYGFRIGLTPDQQSLFDERDNQTLGANSSVPEVPEKAALRNQKGSMKDKSRNQSKPTPSEFHPEVFVQPQAKNFNPTVSRAHITIGCAPKVKAVQTGEDLKDIVNLESRTNSVFFSDYVLDNGDTLRQFGRYGDAFVLYLHNKFIANASFNYKP